MLLVFLLLLVLLILLVLYLISCHYHFPKVLFLSRFKFQFCADKYHYFLSLSFSIFLSVKLRDVPIRMHLYECVCFIFHMHAFFGFALKSINGTMDLPIWNLTRTQKQHLTNEYTHLTNTTTHKKRRRGMKNKNRREKMILRNVFKRIVFRLHLCLFLRPMHRHRSYLILCLIQFSFCTHFFSSSSFCCPQISVLVCIMRLFFFTKIYAENTKSIRKCVWSLLSEILHHCSRYKRS